MMVTMVATLRLQVHAAVASTFSLARNSGTDTNTMQGTRLLLGWYLVCKIAAKMLLSIKNTWMENRRQRLIVLSASS